MASVLFVILGLTAMVIVPVFASAAGRAGEAIAVQPKEPSGFLGQVFTLVGDSVKNAVTFNNEKQADLYVEQAKERMQEAAWLEAYGTSDKDEKKKDKLLEKAGKLQDRATSKIEKAAAKGKDVSSVQGRLQANSDLLTVIEDPGVVDAPPVEEDAPIIFTLPTFTFPVLNLLDLHAAIEAIEQDDRAHPDMKVYLGSVKTKVKSRIDKGETTVDRNASKKPAETGGGGR